MGRIKSLPIKRTTRELLEKYPTLFTEDFEHNKKVVSRIVEADKKTKNGIAGYLSRLVKKSKQKVYKSSGLYSIRLMTRGVVSKVCKNLS